ncbi:hypothetical protein [Aliamphritea spongicola]|nr:hypothetical protein [Aliamphritea spongicola]
MMIDNMEPLETLPLDDEQQTFGELFASISTDRRVASRQLLHILQQGAKPTVTGRWGVSTPCRIMPDTMTISSPKPPLKTAMPSLLNGVTVIWLPVCIT